MDEYRANYDSDNPDSAPLRVGVWNATSRPGILVGINRINTVISPSDCEKLIKMIALALNDLECQQRELMK